MANHDFAASTFSFQRYDVKSNQLYMHLVTPTTQGDVLLKVGEEILPLENAKLEGLFMLRVQVLCESLKTGATLYWATAGNALLQAPIPPPGLPAYPRGDAHHHFRQARRVLAGYR